MDFGLTQLDGLDERIVAMVAYDTGVVRMDDNALDVTTWMVVPMVDVRPRVDVVADASSYVDSDK